MKRLVILISGRGSNMQAMVEAGLPVAAVISNRADAGVPESVTPRKFWRAAVFRMRARGARDSRGAGSDERHGRPAD